jgi:predicted Fe-S protein YdhL (DUF1289 family)
MEAAAGCSGCKRLAKELHEIRNLAQQFKGEMFFLARQIQELEAQLAMKMKSEAA